MLLRKGPREIIRATPSPTQSFLLPFSPQCQGVAPLNISHLKPGSKNVRRRKALPTEPSPQQMINASSAFWKKSRKQNLVTRANPHRKRNKSL